MTTTIEHNGCRLCGSGERLDERVLCPPCAQRESRSGATLSDLHVWGCDENYLSIAAYSPAGAALLRREWHLIHHGCLIHRNRLNVLKDKANAKNLKILVDIRS